MRVIYKYPLHRSPGDNIVTLPCDSEVLSSGYDNDGYLSVWAAVNPLGKATYEALFAVRYTGQPIGGGLRFLGTHYDPNENGVVVHVFHFNPE